VVEPYRCRGGADERSKRNDGWFRPRFIRHDDYPTINPAGRTASHRTYAYHADMKRQLGDGWAWEQGGLRIFGKTTDEYCVVKQH